MYALPVAETLVDALMPLLFVDTSAPPEEAVLLVEKFSLVLYIGTAEDNDPLSLVAFVAEELELSPLPPAIPPVLVPDAEEEEDFFEDDLDNLRLSLTVAAFMRFTNSLKLLKL